MGLKKSGDAAALRRIEPREYPRDADGLIAQLQDADPSVRRWAARDLAAHVNIILDDPAKMRALGAASRQRVEQYFSWTSIARQTLDFYQELAQA